MLDRMLLQMVVLDFQPFSIVEDEGFVKFVSALDDRYSLPGRFTLSNTLLNKYYKEAKQEMVKILSKAKLVF